MRRGLYAGVALALMLAVVGWMGCGGKHEDEHTTMSLIGAGAQGPDEQRDHEMMTMCPMGVAGTQVAYQEAPDGAGLSFTTQSAGVLELRRRVTAMVDMVNMHQSQGHGDMHGSGQGMSGCGAGGDQGMMGGGSMTGGMMGGESMSGCLMMAVPSRALYAEVEGGAQVMLIPTDPAQLSRLRTETEAHAARMAAGDCPMMKAGSDPDAGSGGTGGGDHGTHH